MLAFCFFSIETFAIVLVQPFNGHHTLLILWVRSTQWTSTCNECNTLIFSLHFLQKLSVVDPDACVFAYISTTTHTQARHFKFAGAAVQRL